MEDDCRRPLDEPLGGGSLGGGPLGGGPRGGGPRGGGPRGGGPLALFLLFSIFNITAV
jgi:hypothetical protein